jgi:hypothetical protein
MQTKNYLYLTERLRETGIGDSLDDALQIKIADKLNAFVLDYTVCFDNHELAITLFFTKWKDIGMYYLRKYHAVLRRGPGNEPVGRDFYFGRPDPVVTLPEAYNLLSGRAVYRESLTSKEKTTYNAWVQLDFAATDNVGNFKWRYFHSQYGYDLEAVLLTYPIQEVADLTIRRQLITALQQGNRVPVTFIAHRQATRYLIEAMPRFKNLNVYHADGQLLSGKEIQALIAPPVKKNQPTGAEGSRRKIPIQ